MNRLTEIILLAICSVIVLAALYSTAAKAFDSDIRTTDAIVEEHKAFLLEHASADEDDSDAIVYERSQKAKEAAHANQVIANAYGRRL